ncbi:MAG: hypothetical protein COX57_02385 [Alphaproteobacteria bacterium CG_4_10_14_0_2_um_filter_63_37]|nr:MAG: hypothetical protein AUJ55_13390 [Proteobacteria bacterium CG1_02_64_396]PJA25607.1 MAG: hypothetical protein COX57_02385 [Alphaproteobacteria bacterium CG_4_10_14_0_2_um_filter_63_37]
MKPDAIKQMKNRFDALSQRVPGTNRAFWFARNPVGQLGYALQTAMKRAMASCETTGRTPDDHFCGITNMDGSLAGGGHAQN